MRRKSSKENSIGRYLYLLLAAGLCLLLASRSSLLYPMNNWDDANSYFSVGKALFNGRMPYRDVFDQKGPYLYFFYGLAYLVSHTTFVGVFLLELLFGAVDLTGFYRILRLYASEQSSLALSPVVYALLIGSRSFWWGGSAEEIALPFLVWGLYLSVSYFKKEYAADKMPYRTVFLGGLFAGVIANIKFTLLGFFFAWMLGAGLSYLAHKDFKGALRACFVFLFGMALPFVPWLLYFGIRGGLYAWYWGYAYVNVFVYSKAQSLGSGLFERCYALTKLLYNLAQDNRAYFGLVLPGLLYTLFQRKQKLLSRIQPLLLFGFLFLGIFGGGRELPYYVLPLGIFAVFGAALLGVLLDQLFQRKKSEKGITVLLSGVCVLASMVFLYVTSMNIPFMAQKKDDFFLFRFRDEILAEAKEPTLLNVGCLDAGLYTLCDIVPSCRYFQTQTWHTDDPADDPYAEQARYIAEGLVDFVLVRNDIPDEIELHYQLIDSEDYGWDGLEFTYYLYQKVY